MQNYLLIASLGYLASLAAAVAIGYLIASLKHEIKRLMLDNAQLKERCAELETNGQYPKRRTHADIRRMEDAIAVADQLRMDAELFKLHHEQDARLERERLDDLATQIERLTTRLGETRNSRPDEYPE